MKKGKDGLLKVKCQWVHENCFYWHCEEYVVETKKGVFKDTKLLTLVKEYKKGDMSSVIQIIQDKALGHYDVFNIEIDTTKL